MPNGQLPVKRSRRRLAPTGAPIGQVAARMKRHQTQFLKDWQSTVAGILACGRDLVNAKADLPRGAWIEYLDSHLPITRQTGYRLMAIAGDPRLADVTQRVPLPPHWGTLYELTKLDNSTFTSLLDQGVINPNLTRAELKTALARLGVAARGPAPDLADLPAGRYRAILADPPWAYETWGPGGKDRSQEAHYPTMSLEEIAALPVRELAAPDCMLFLWAQYDSLPMCRGVVEGWGFRYSTIGFIWDKETANGNDHFGKGHWTRMGSEPCVFATIGSPRRLDKSVRQIIRAPVREHSRKPDETYARIERLVAGPYLELFANPPARDGWDTWGQPHRDPE